MKAIEERLETASKVKYPGIPDATDGTGAVVTAETLASEAAGAYPITPSTQMGEGWAVAAAAGTPNANGRRLIFFEPEGEHAAAGVTAGMSMVGLRSANFSSGQGIAYMHESLYAAVGKRLTYVLNMACRAMTKHALNVHAGHDDYHAVDDTGFFQVFAKDAQEGADLNLIAHRIAELALTPGICAQDGFLTSHVLESVRLPEPELVREYLGDPSDIIESPTPAQRMVFGTRRRRIPEMFDLDNPAMLGVVQNQDSYAQGVASQRPFFFDHVRDLTDQAMAEYEALTGRHYARTVGYKTEDAEFVILGQGSLIPNAEAVVDHLRQKGLKVGVVNVTMFRPFPADGIVALLKGKRGVAVLERVDQPLAADAPLIREVRTAMAKAMENGRAAGGARSPATALPHPDIPPCRAEEVPDFYSGCFGMGSRDLQPGDLVAAVENMLPGGRGRRQFYLGIDFIRTGDVPPKLKKWQDEIAAAYPGVKDLALPTSGDLDLLPPNSMAVRIHSVGGWGAITMGKNLTMTLFSLLGMSVKSNPKYGSEKKGQPTTFYGVFAHEPIRTNCELKHVDVVLSPDPNVFRHSNPLAGLREGGVFIIQTDKQGEAFWNSIPGWAQRAIRERSIRVFGLDAFAVARAETDEPDLQYRMQGAAFQGAFFRSSPIMEREKMKEGSLFETIRHQLDKKFGHRGASVVESNYRIIRRGFDEVEELDWKRMPEKSGEARTHAELTPPWYLHGEDSGTGIADGHRFMSQVCELYRRGEDPIADPFAALSAIPAATGIFRDMTGIRFEVPEFVAEKCTGCGQCWIQCPDAAIPGLVSEVVEVVRTAVYEATDGTPSEPLRKLVAPLAEEARARLRNEEFTSFASTLTRAYGKVAKELELTEPARAALDSEFDRVAARVAEVPLARTTPFFTVPERKQPGTGGLLSVTINPYACKGCNLCVEVCPDQALVTVKQDEAVVEKLRRNWKTWERLPDTPDHFVQVADVDEGIGVLGTLLLKKRIFHSMVGGDGSCMGCGEKTGVHLIVAAIEAHTLPKVAVFVKQLEDILRRLDDKVSSLLLSSTDLERVTKEGKLHVDVEVAPENRERLARLTKIIRDLKDVHWRYTRGPTGRGRAAVGITNATGCSSVWGSTYPYNPYPYPWTNHLFQDAPSVAIGIFEGVMRKMGDGFAAVRKAELELGDAYNPKVHDKFFEAFDWTGFTDDEFRLCPPIMAIGGDGAMLDIGFQNVSRLMASGKPLRVLVLDTQVYSNTGGQACTSGFRGQISDMAAYGAAHHGKEEHRKEMSLIAIAHRSTYVLQSSQAHPSHLLAGVLRGLSSRRPALFNLYSPCQAEHGLSDAGSAHAAKLAAESRAYPYLVYDPDAGPTLAERLSLEGNPDLQSTWPTYDLTYVDESGEERTMTIPLTVADWAATEPRFGRHFRPVKRAEWTDRMIPFAEYLELDEAGRKNRVPFIHVVGEGRRLGRTSVSPEMVELARDRIDLWRELTEMAGINPSPKAREVVQGELEADLTRQMDALRAEYEQKIAHLKATYPEVITRRIAAALVEGRGTMSAPSPSSWASMVTAVGTATGSAVALAEPVASATAAAALMPAAPAPAAEAGALEPYIDTELCTTCNECTNLNPRMFVYNADKKAVFKDPRAGTFREMVLAAEKCPAQIIHPGTPLKAKEPDLAKWVKRAARFNS